MWILLSPASLWLFFGCSWGQQRNVCKCAFCSLVLPRRCQTLFCGVLILLNTLIKGRGLHQSLQVHCVPLLGTVCKSQVHFGTAIGSWDLFWKLHKWFLLSVVLIQQSMKYLGWKSCCKMSFSLHLCRQTESEVCGFCWGVNVPNFYFYVQEQSVL